MQDLSNIPSPCFVLEEKKLLRNMELLKHVQDQSGAKIICALKGFAMFSAFPMMRPYLAGTTASSLYEARLGTEEFGKELHVCCPVYLEKDIDAMLALAGHITFNSLSQWERFKPNVLKASNKVSCGLRINPQYSEVKTDMYNPCIPGSRLGITADKIGDKLPEGIEGLHFHTLCGNDSHTLERTLAEVEKRFGHLLHQAKWLNMGGGHHITKEGYDVEKLIRLIKGLREKYQVEVILEPGEAVGWQTGFLLSTVQDILDSQGIQVAMLDVSVSAHMPDCLEMPYKASIIGASDETPGKPTYRIGGLTCLAGDYMGDYSFDEELKVGDTLIFDDMIHYTMVKTTMFNGVNLPSIGILQQNGEFRLVRSFSYEDYRNRLS